MAGLDLTLTADCYTITKTFERASHYAATEESVYAMMTPVLNNMRINSDAFTQQWNLNQGLDSQGGNAVQLEKVDTSTVTSVTATGSVPGVSGSVTKDKDSVTLSVETVGNLKKCIPCEFRITFKSDLKKQMFASLKNLANQYAAYFKDQLQQLMDMAIFFDLKAKVFDVCALKKMLSLMCLPDLRRIIAAMMAILAKLAFEFNSIFDMILSLVAPLMLPFLMSIMNPIQQFMLLIIKPLECVINHLAQMIDKLDYGQLFNAQELAKLSISLGPKNTPAKYKSQAVPTGLGNWGTTINLNPFQNVIQDQQIAINNADAELAAIQAKAAQTNLSNIQARQQYLKALADAQAKKNEALKKQESLVAQGTDKLRLLEKQMVSFAWNLMAHIREAIDMIQSWIDRTLGEIRKILQSIGGGNGLTILKLYKKLEILQVIEMVMGIIKVLGNPQNCDDKKVPIDASSISFGKDVLVSQDVDGTIHISEDPNLFASMQPAQSMVKLTGDPVLDTKLARAVNLATTAQNASYKCPLQTSIPEAQQVNDWVQQLSKA